MSDGLSSSSLAGVLDATILLVNKMQKRVDKVFLVNDITEK
ncbi:hypothetical protein [Romboutsia sp. MSSM.1001216sp_RTP31141st1_G3_RTP31141_220114]